MAKYNEVFNRVEKKYLLNKETMQKLLEELLPYVEKDDYYNYSVYNIYYDTIDSQMIQTSLQKPTYKEKLRLRSYTPVSENSTVFIEMKKKIDTTVFKRRISLNISEAVDYLDKKQSISTNTQIKKEIDYMLKMYQPVKKLYLAYDRIAFHGKSDHELRITFDKNIRYRHDNLSLNDTSHDEHLLKDNQYLMEIKLHDSFPVWLSNILTRLNIYPASFSKYGEIYSKELTQRKLTPSYKRMEEYSCLTAY